MANAIKSDFNENLLLICFHKINFVIFTDFDKIFRKMTLNVALGFEPNLEHNSSVLPFGYRVFATFTFKCCIRHWRKNHNGLGAQSSINIRFGDIYSMQRQLAIN